ncbi:hypothetical protein [Ruegeria sp. HKCCD7221]|uniref:hypothetical protein n=1 Tax=Ruegeria sp. HKCCD7221 TaxID=2683009 RepID=UPI001489EBCF|nr:hypothetical protein [Ruegeria sp. HKCCD7221]
MYETNTHLELSDWIASQHFSVFGTLKFTDGFEISEFTAEPILKRYFCMLDRAYYGNAATNVGMRHQRLVFKHLGSSGQNLHYHFLAKPYTDPQLFSHLARKQWASMGSWTMSEQNTQIGPVLSNQAASKYVLHEYRSLGPDCLLLAASNLTPPSRDPLKFRNLAQLRRLLKLQQREDDQLSMAWQAMPCPV